MTIEQVTMWKDNYGNLHETEGDAKLANGDYALAEAIKKEFGPTPVLTLADVTAYITGWYRIWLEGTK